LLQGPCSREQALQSPCSALEWSLHQLTLRISGNGADAGDALHENWVEPAQHTGMHPGA